MSTHTSTHTPPSCCSQHLPTVAAAQFPETALYFTLAHTHYIDSYQLMCLSAQSTFNTCVNMCLHFGSVKCSRTMVGCSECDMAGCVCVCVGIVIDHTHPQAPPRCTSTNSLFFSDCVCFSSPSADKTHHQLFFGL